MKTLVAGWFSFEGCNVTAGDLMARDLTCAWLEEAGFPYDIALAKPFVGGVDWKTIDPTDYPQVVFVCGPFPLDTYTKGFVERFNHCRLVGLDLSMLESPDVWNPFDILIERDSSRCSNPDITFLCKDKKVPVVGLILVHPQVEYGERSKHHLAYDAIQSFISSHEMVVVPIDTGLDPNTTNLRNSVELESLIARMDLVITTRLHGTALSIKNGVPVIAIDAIAGGAKVSQQAKAIGWDICLTIDQLSDDTLQHAFDYCLTQDARLKVERCRLNAVQKVEAVKDKFISLVTNPNTPSERTASSEANEKLESLSNKWTLLKRQMELKKYEVKGNIRQWFFKKLYRPQDNKWIAENRSIFNK